MALSFPVRSIASGALLLITAVLGSSGAVAQRKGAVAPDAALRQQIDQAALALEAKVVRTQAWGGGEWAWVRMQPRG